MSVRLFPVILALILAILVAGCSDDDECPTCPEGSDDPVPTFANIWPHADGNAWTYDLQNIGYEGDPSDQVEPGEPIPDLPSMDELHARLTVPIDNEIRGSSEGAYRLFFDGDITTEAGVTAQYLRDETFSSDGLLVSPPTTDYALPKDIGDDPNRPFLLSGYAFAATDTGHFGYFASGTDYRWIYLTESLDVGQEFSIRFYDGQEPQQDNWLHGRVYGIGDLEIQGHTYRNCVECFYVVDWGATEVIDEHGNVLAEGRPYTYGSIYYAPTFGPVTCHERAHFLSDSLLENGPGILETKVEISGLQITWP